MQIEAKQCLEDVRHACELLLTFTCGKNFDSYEADALLRSAVERQFEVIGEAVNRLSRTEPAIADALPDAPRIVAFRNILIHAYDVVQTNLRPLHEKVGELLTADGPPA